MNMQPFTATENAGPGHKLLDVTFAEFAYLLFLLLIFVGLEPFAPRTVAGAAPAVGAGDALRQISYLAAFALIAMSAFRMRGFAALRAVPLAIWLLLCWCVASALWSATPDVTFRRAALASIVVLSSYLTIDSVGVERGLQLWRWVLAVILIVNWIAIPLIPQAIHLPGDPEGSIVGDWRGLYYHKNIAGSIAATSVIVFLFAWLEKRRARDAFFTLAALAFLVMTRSKSSMGLLPLALLLGWASRFSSKGGLDRSIALVAGAITLIVGFTMLAIYSDAIARLLEDPEQFTGRAAIWQAELAYIRDHLFLGSGFGSFTDTGSRSPLYAYMGSTWIQTVAQGHNGYLELLVTIGGIGFALAMAAFVLQPWIDFHRPTPSVRQDTLLFTIFCFVLLHNVMESDFLSGDGAQWVAFLLTTAMVRTSRRADLEEHIAGTWRM